MSTPKGKSQIPIILSKKDQVHLYTDAKQIILQIRHEVPSEEDLLSPSVKVAVELSPANALRLASLLLAAAVPRISSETIVDEPEEKKTEL